MKKEINVNERTIIARENRILNFGKRECGRKKKLIVSYEKINVNEQTLQPHLCPRFFLKLLKMFFQLYLDDLKSLIFFIKTDKNNLLLENC